MVIVHGLRILTDLAFYYAFASYISVCFGGRYAMVGLLVQAACFALSATLREKPCLRLAALLPSVLLWLLPGIGLADGLLFLPPAVLFFPIYMPSMGPKASLYHPSSRRTSLVIRPRGRRT